MRVPFSPYLMVGWCAQILRRLTRVSETKRSWRQREIDLSQNFRIPLSFLRELSVLRGESSRFLLLFLFFRIRDRFFENCQHRLHLRPFDPAVDVEIADSGGAAVFRFYVVFWNFDAQRHGRLGAAPGYRFLQRDLA